MASLSVAPLDSVSPASGKQYDFFCTGCQRLAEKKHGALLWSMVISNGTDTVVNVAFVGSVSLGDQPTKLKDVQGLVQIFQAFMFGAIEEEVLT